MSEKDLDAPADGAECRVAFGHGDFLKFRTQRQCQLMDLGEGCRQDQAFGRDAAAPQRRYLGQPLYSLGNDNGLSRAFPEGAVMDFPDGNACHFRRKAFGGRIVLARRERGGLLLRA